MKSKCALLPASLTASYQASASELTFLKEVALLLFKSNQGSQNISMKTESLRNPTTQSDLCPTASRPTHPNSLQIEQIHLLYVQYMLKGRFILWIASI